MSAVALPFNEEIGLGADGTLVIADSYGNSYSVFPSKSITPKESLLFNQALTSLTVSTLFSGRQTRPYSTLVDLGLGHCLQKIKEPGIYIPK